MTTSKITPTPRKRKSTLAGARPKQQRSSADVSVMRTKPLLWEACKLEAKRRMGGKHSARAMQLAVQMYKRAGGGYRTARPRRAASNALMRWTEEQWGYAGRPGQSRYLPLRVRQQLAPSERRRTNAAKKKSARQYSRQPADVAAKAARIRKAMWRRKI
jgi:hypothetical protein